MSNSGAQKCGRSFYQVGDLSRNLFEVVPASFQDLVVSRSRQSWEEKNWINESSKRRYSSSCKRKWCGWKIAVLSRLRTAGCCMVFSSEFFSEEKTDVFHKKVNWRNGIFFHGQNMAVESIKNQLPVSRYLLDMF